jgi:hypothetical protein
MNGLLGHVEINNFFFYATKITPSHTFTELDEARQDSAVHDPSDPANMSTRRSTDGELLGPS